MRRPPAPAIKERSTRPRQSYRFVGGCCRGRSRVRVHGTDGAGALRRRDRSSLKPKAVRAPSPLLIAKPTGAPRRRRESDGWLRLSVSAKCKPRIHAETLDISALSAERLWAESWIVHGPDYHHFGTRCGV